jgi:hypothetical protein
VLFTSCYPTERNSFFVSTQLRMGNLAEFLSGQAGGEGQTLHVKLRIMKHKDTDTDPERRSMANLTRQVIQS